MDNHQKPIQSTPDHLKKVHRAYVTLKEMLLLYRLRRPKSVLVMPDFEKATEMHELFSDCSQDFLGGHASRVRCLLYDSRYPERLEAFLATTDDLHVLVIDANEFIGYYPSVVTRSTKRPMTNKPGHPLDPLHEADGITYFRVEEDDAISRQSLEGMFHFTEFVYTLEKSWDDNATELVPLSDPYLFKQEPLPVFKRKPVIDDDDPAPF